MVLYFLLGIAALAALGWAARNFTSMRPQDIAHALRTFFAVLSGLAGMGLMVAGRFGIALMLLLATAITVRKLRSGRRGADPWARNAGSTTGTSEIETRFLRMRLDRATGEIDGEIIDGAFAGRKLASLSLGELLQLLHRVRLDDALSVSLVEAFLDRHHPDWREFNDSTQGGDDGRSRSGDVHDVMTDAMALDILGLRDGATAEEIRQAHRRLMARFHPDHGGSTYLASQINRARELLLSHLDTPSD